MFKRQLSYQMLKVIDQRKLTLESVAEASGLSRKFVGNIINGKQVPTLDSFEKICAALELEPNDLLLSDNSKSADKTVAMSVNTIFCQRENNARFYVPVCPSCHSLLSVERQGYCDRCGQKLSWSKYSTSDVTFEKPKKLTKV